MREQNVCKCICSFTWPKLQFHNLVNNETIPPTDELDAMKDPQRVQNHEEFLEIDGQLSCCNTNDQNYNDDIIEHATKKNKMEDGENDDDDDDEILPVTSLQNCLLTKVIF